ncbi:sensor histidine kinase [Kibdelosporangium lantanae]
MNKVDPRVFDTLAAIVLFGLTCLAGLQYHPRFDTLAYVLSAVVNLPLAGRRRAPVVVLLVSSAGFAGYLAAGHPPSYNYWGPTLALYTVATLRSHRVSAACAVLTAGLLFYSGLLVYGLSFEVNAAQALIVPGIAWAFGDNVRKLAIATKRLKEEQRERTMRAVTEERVRIARELHDVVAHHMSVISVQAGLAGYVFTSDPPTAKAALGTIGDTSREALHEMRRLLAVLRFGPDEADDFGPAPGLDGLRDLVDRAHTTGVPIALDITGLPRPLPPGLDLCAYRVVQEAVTNVLKHSQPTAVAVVVDYRPRAVVIRVTNDGANSPDGETGHGLIGMRERARLYQGEVTVGHPRPGQFEVELTLPTPEQG